MHERETTLRSLMKSVTWRIIATITTTILVFIFTGSLAIAFSLGLIEIVVKYLIYFIHERAWDQILWGKVWVTTE